MLHGAKQKAKSIRQNLQDEQNVFGRPIFWVKTGLLHPLC